ncbi:SOS response-associated peptidase [Brevibacillus sp. SYSU BS000544]|uniref:SOS response-associated peptidase n=1 Tax=Brevibacillus sp. SYSU BS000544 TaxID=3416443 RepID=UPI003CE55EE5
MCGRFSLFAEPAELIKRFGIHTFTFDFLPSYNIAPGQNIPAILSDQGERRMGQLHWGLIPSWAKDESIGYKLINAKAETIQEKPSFRTLFVRKRCLIPVDGFYEWKKTSDGKQPMRIVMKNREPFGLAGLFDTWVKPNGQKVHSCTIITTEPNGIMDDIHERMPVIIGKEHEELWLNRDFSDTQVLQSLLQPYDEQQMEAYPVSTIVGNVRNNHSECIADITKTL